MNDPYQKLIDRTAQAWGLSPPIDELAHTLIPEITTHTWKLHQSEDDALKAAISVLKEDFRNQLDHPTHSKSHMKQCRQALAFLEDLRPKQLRLF